MSSKNLDNKHTQSKLTFIKPNDNKKLKKDTAKLMTVVNVTELKGKQKEPENIMDIDSTTATSSQTTTQPTSGLLDLTDIVNLFANPPPSNWAEETNRMLVKHTFMTLSTADNTFSLRKNLTAAILHDENTSGTNQNEVLPVNKETLQKRKLLFVYL